uniref:F-box domain-containing protein n=1 Tax=Ditylenchus dipsaci TaxID=166011 RepID=A0A915DRW3_9BILA
MARTSFEKKICELEDSLNTPVVAKKLTVTTDLLVQILHFLDPVEHKLLLPVSRRMCELLTKPIVCRQEEHIGNGYQNLVEVLRNVRQEGWKNALHFKLDVEERSINKYGPLTIFWL